MTHDEFKRRLEEIYKDICPSSSHESADDFLVEVLEDMGFDLTCFKEAVKWYGE